MNAGTFGLQLDLETGRVSHQFGFDQAPVEEGNRSVSARHRWASETRTLFAAGRFFSVDDSAALGERLRELAASDSEPSRCGIDGDFVIIAIDEPGRRLVLWSDRNGASRCYYTVRGSTLFLSNSRLEIARMLGDARLSAAAVYQVLALGYVIDPESLIEGVSVTQSGQRITIDRSGTQVVRYEEPVRMDAEYYRDGATAVRELDDSLRAVFQKRVSGRNPCILLSGGIDSVAMLRYARDAYSGPITTLTFSVRNLPRNELEPAGIAARYFQTDHHELVVDPAHAATHFSRMLLESDSFDYASLFGMAEREALLADGRSFDVFSGQDNRLHTPTFDLPRELAATVIRKVGGRGPARLALRSASTLLRAIPAPPRAQGYLRHWAKHLEPQPDFQQYLLDALIGFRLPRTESAARTRLLRQLPEVTSSDGIQEIFKKVVAFSCRSQHTDDMNAMASALIAPRIAPHLPFFDWQAVETFNRIPYRIGAKRALSTQTWSPMPVVQKWVLRQALRGHVPDELLYRAKTTSPSSYKLMEGPLRTFALALLDQWQEPLLESLDSEVRDLARQTIEDFRSRSVFHRNEDESLLVAIFSLSFVAMLAAACAGADVKKTVAKTLEKTLPARRPQAHMVAS